MKILIAGSPKTGTTGLYYKLRNSWGGGSPRLLFEEPEPYRPEPGDDERGVLAKVVINPDTEDLTPYLHFDRKIAIVRDPRDTLISRLMYGIGYHSPYDRDDRQVARMYAFLRRLEASDGELGVLDLIRFDWGLRGIAYDDATIRAHYAAEWARIENFYARYPDFFPFKYEDFVVGRLDALSEYLGMELSGSSDVDPKHARVVRTKSSGDWRHWFRPTDAALLRTIYEDFLIRYGYDTDWAPHASPQIEPQFASEYFYRLVSEKRALILRPVARETLVQLARQQEAC